MSRVKVVRGMKDILPADAGRWHQVEDHARSVFEGYGYHELRPPILEHTELFQRSIGEATDIIEKEMYTFSDRRGRSLSMRPEATASCVRAVVEAALTRTHKELRIWYSGPMFRYEKMQRERYRQFYQLGAEIYGRPDGAADAEIILLTARLWRSLGLAGIDLDLNCLGTREEQSAYRARLLEYLRDNEGDLDEDSVRRLQTNPLRVLDSKNPQLQPLIEAAPAPVDHLLEASSEHFAQVKSILDRCGIMYQVNRRLVRGLDYYTRTVFEWVSGDLGAQNAVCGGGRYDRLFEEIGGVDVPAVGFSAGIERIIAVMQQQSIVVPERTPQIFLAAVGPGPRTAALAIAERLRDAMPRCRILVDSGEGSFKAKLKRADRSGAPFAVLLGEDELTRGQVQLKSLRGGGQWPVSLEELSAAVSAVLEPASAADHAAGSPGSAVELAGTAPV